MHRWGVLAGVISGALGAQTVSPQLKYPATPRGLQADDLSGVLEVTFRDEGSFGQLLPIKAFTT